jgi:hypothetical protein
MLMKNFSVIFLEKNLFLKLNWRKLIKLNKNSNNRYLPLWTTPTWACPILGACSEASRFGLLTCLVRLRRMIRIKTTSRRRKTRIRRINMLKINMIKTNQLQKSEGEQIDSPKTRSSTNKYRFSVNHLGNKRLQINNYLFIDTVSK